MFLQVFIFSPIILKKKLSLYITPNDLDPKRPFFNLLNKVPLFDFASITSLLYLNIFILYFILSLLLTVSDNKIKLMGSNQLLHST